MAFVVIRRHWHEEVVALYRHPASLKILPALMRTAIRFAGGSVRNSEHGDYWIEAESRRGDIITNPVIVRPEHITEVLQSLGIPNTMIALLREPRYTIGKYERLKASVREVLATKGGSA